MKCVSVRQPWATALVKGFGGVLKDVENRTWEPSFKQLKRGERLAIHASKMFDVDGLRWICANHKELGLKLEDIPIDPKAYPVGCVIGSVEFDGSLGEILYRSAPVDKQSPWFFGPIGWLIQDSKPLAEPVPMKGRLMLFDVPDEIFEQKETKEKE